MNRSRISLVTLKVRQAVAACVLGLLLAPAPLLAQTGWLPQTLPALPAGSSYAISAASALSPNDVWIAGNIKPGDDIVIARTANGGTQWQVVRTSVTGSISRLKVLSNDVGFICGPDLFRSTTDGGATWIQEQGNLPDGVWHNIGPGRHNYGLAVVDGTHIWTAGYDGYSAGVIFHRKPERPQNPQNLNTNAPWWLEWAQDYHGMYGIAAANGQVAWAVGYAGYIWKTVDGGDGWGQQTSNTGVALNDVAALDANTAWVVGDGGVILKTTDGGTTWVAQGSGTTESLRRIAAVDASVAWAVGTNGVILRTADGGATWRAQVSGTNATLSGVAAVNATTAWVVGEGVLLATTDGGTYQPLSAPGIRGASPAGGPVAGGTAPVFVQGRDFLPGARVYFGGVPAAVTAYRTPGELMVTTPAHGAGIVDVTVVNPDGQSATRAKAFAFADTQPWIVGLSTTYGYVDTPTVLDIYGAGLTPAKGTYLPVPTVNINGADVPGTDADYDWMQFVLDRSRLTTTGLADIKVTTAAGGTSNTLKFAINPGFVEVQKPPTPPYDKAVTIPSLSGTIQAAFHGLTWGGSVRVGKAFDDPQWIGYNSPPPTGYRLLPSYYYDVATYSSSMRYQAATFCFPYSDSDLAAASLDDESRLRLMRFFYGPDNTPTWEDVTVTLDAAANRICGTFPEPMLYVALAQGPQTTPPPEIRSIVPAISPAGGGSTVTINGRRFPAGATVTFGGVAATNVTVANGIKITATIPPHALGPVDVAVSAPGGPSGALTDGFEYVGAPTVTSLTPGRGYLDTQVTITGSGFRDGCTVAFGGQTAVAYSITDTAIMVDAPQHAAGLVDVVVTNVDGQSAMLAKAFTYVAAPTVAYVEPNAGPAEGGTAVTITGTDFQAGAVVTFGYTEATGVVVVNPTTITAVTPAATEGKVDVTVSNPDNQSGTSGWYGGFTYGRSPSIITWANPASIPYGTKLSGVQLNATVNADGTLFYPEAGSTPPIGVNTLTVYFNPTDADANPRAQKSVSLVVLPALGDVNADGVVNVRDAILVLQALSAKPTPGISAGAALQGHGTIGLPEALFILQKAAGIRQ